MTDGIIQEVFRDFMNRNNYDIRDMVIHFPELQQELIEKIKQSIEYHEGCYHIQRGCSLKTDLIGDNQK